MFKTANPLESPINTPKIDGLIKKRLKYWLIWFGRTFYDQDLTYVDKLLKKWLKATVTSFISITVNGIAIFAALFGIIYTFPKLATYTHLASGNKIPISVFLLGISYVWITKVYRYFKIDYKNRR